MSYYKTYQDYRDSWDKAYQEDPPIILNLDIELASLCSLACSYCYWGESEFKNEMKALDWDGLPKKRFMPTDLAIRLIDEAAEIGIPALKMNARGESVLHPEYSKILQYAKSKNSFHEILVNSHGNCREDAIDGYMAATKVMISLDSTLPDLYPKLRIGGNLDRVISTIKELQKRKHSNLWVRRVVSNINEHEDFIGNCHKLFGPDIKVSEHFSFDRNRHVNSNIHGEEPEKWERQYCLYPSQRLLITSSGAALPCCVDWSMEMIVGFYPKQSLLDIWNGEKIKNLRTELRNNIFKSEICRKCTSYLAYKRPERNYVQDVLGKAIL